MRAYTGWKNLTKRALLYIHMENVTSEIMATPLNQVNESLTNSDSLQAFRNEAKRE